jgi:beta-propeller repeat-containing protein/beta-propeller uncharacterized protein DUF5122
VGIALVLALTVLGAPAAGPSTFSQVSAAGRSRASPPAAETRERVGDAYGALPLSFTPNAGQVDPQVRYSAQGSGFGVAFTPGEMLFSFEKGRRGHVLGIRFLGASPEAALTARSPLPGTVNFLVGKQADWRIGLPTFQQIVYQGVWPGIDVVVSGGGGTLKYEFHVAPGSAVSDVRLAYEGGGRLSLTGAGDLLIKTPLGTLRDARPVSYQLIGGRRVEVSSRYIPGSDGNYGFALGKGYDPSRAVVIDPSLQYSSFLGGSSGEAGLGIAVDQAGHAYVTGGTSSADFPITPGAFDTTHNGNGDAFISKLTPDGSALAYSTFLGGTDKGYPGYGIDGGFAITIDEAGHAYVTGLTGSFDFPTTPGAFDRVYNGGERDVFMTKLSPDGSNLDYSTFLGGRGWDEPADIAIDPAGRAYVTGTTPSTDFPTTPGAFDRTLGGEVDAFVTGFSPQGSSLVYSTLLGGSGYDPAFGIGVDSAGHAFVSGDTTSPDFPTTPGAYDPTFNGEADAYVSKLTPDGSALVYSTFVGGRDGDAGFGSALDAAGEAFVTGLTTSGDFPTTPGAFDTTYNGANDAFVAKLNADGSALVYSTFLGGARAARYATEDDGYDIAVDAKGRACVIGFTESPGFPTTPGAFDRTYNGTGDAFVTVLSPEGSTLVYSTFLGGSHFEPGFRIGVRTGIASASHIYVTGWTDSSDFPTTPGAFDRSFDGGDAFVAKFVIGDKTTR